ncbi:Rv3235 family protein [Neomicrococcus lactis]|uniref:Uncharacterized protein n=1 Tax=Neomicrococcus lactis TaxID=732241 RepID=A0A7W8Y976_9MICC|nr:Rv3235 family protein [Neomicrococcus lactis]MBB5597249.1 hypothetical protein [Neomicrococcus lactis]
MSVQPHHAYFSAEPLELVHPPTNELPDNVIRFPQKRKFVDYAPTNKATGPADLDEFPQGLPPAPEEKPPVAPRPVPSPAIQHVHHLVTFVSVASIEAVAGLRSVSQLQRFVSLQVLDKLKRRADLLAHTSSPMGSRVQAMKRPSNVMPSRIAHVLSVRVCHVNDKVFEAVAVVKDLERVRPIAMRIECQRNNWRVTHYEVG